MNTTRTNTAKFLKALGNIAAYGFWITSALAVLGFIAVLFTYDTPVAYQVGQALAVVGIAMFFSILLMGACFTSLKARGAL